MATFQSDEIALQTPSKVPAAEGLGIKRVKHFNFTVPAAGLVDIDQVQLALLPPNSIIYGRESLFSSDTAATGGAPTYAIGYEAYRDNTGGDLVAADIDGFVIGQTLGVDGNLWSEAPGAAIPVTAASLFDANNRTELLVTFELTGTTPALAAGAVIKGYVTFSITS